MRVFLALLGAGVVGLVMMPACGGGAVTLAEPPGAFDGGLEGGEGGLAGRGVGQRCDDGGLCRPGLACTAGVCQPGHALADGAACVISAECKDGLYCGPDRKCVAAGTGAAGATCTSDGDCKSGFRCNLVGLDAQCQPEGTNDVGGMCALSGDCFGGLLCADKTCAPPPPGGPPPLGIPSFKGVVCEDETGPVTAHFSVPRGAADKDYFRLPFPNDIRMKSGKLDLTGFPTPGSDLLGYDLVDRLGALPRAHRHRVERIPDGHVPLQRRDRLRVAQDQRCDEVGRHHARARAATSPTRGRAERAAPPTCARMP